MEIGAVIQGDGVVTNLEFHDAGQYLVSTTNESSIQLIDCHTGTEKRKVFAKNSGVGKVQFTHHESSILMSTSSRASHDIKYLCLYDNRYLRYFHSHTDEVTSLSMSPISDHFLSASLDKSICVWDMQSPGPVAKLSLPSHFDRPICSYDTSGVVFGVLCQDTRYGGSALKLFDARAYEHGPFQNIFPSVATMESAVMKCNPAAPPSRQLVSRVLGAQWTGFEFSADGGHSVLVNTNTEAFFLLNGFKGTEEPVVFLGRKNDGGLSLGATFSADAKSVITASEDNDILVFDKTTTELTSTLTGMDLT